MMDGAGWDKFHGDYKKLSKKLSTMNLEFTVHPPAWDINLTAEMEDLRKVAFQIHQDTLKFSADIGAAHMVFHPGFSGSPCFSKKTAQARAHEAVCSLAEIANKCGVKLAFENVGYHGQSIYTEEEYSHALDQVDPIVGYLIDTGHANVNHWDIKSLIVKVSSRLIGYHIHDNNGKSDQHLPMGMGTIGWDEIYKAMIKVHSVDFDYVLEYAPGTDFKSYEEGKNLLGHILNN